MNETILVLNAGSSSIKFALYPLNDTSRCLARGQIARVGHEPVYEVKGAEPRDLGIGAAAGHRECIAWLAERIRKDHGDIVVAAAGHRVVHGGRAFGAAARITPDAVAEMRALAPLAPLHQPHNLAGIETVSEIWPEVPQIACFDTGFHRDRSRVARMFPLPRRLMEQGLERFGFHGLSYEFIASQLPEHLGERADGRVIVLHLGHGASLCAMHGRKSVDTSMGFTALGGIMMGTRPGDLDPGLLLHMIEQMGMDAREVTRIVNKEAGLLGVSGISSDMRDLLASETDAAREAVDLFVHCAVQGVGRLMATLGGLDALVFTGGIGEHAPVIRARISEAFGWLGLTLDAGANESGARCVSAAGSRIDVLAIPTDEERMIARHTQRHVAGG